MAMSYPTGSMVAGHPNARTDALILGTVNAPFKTPIDAHTLRSSLETGNDTARIVHRATFLADVSPALVLEFTQARVMWNPQLARADDAVKAEAGVKSAALETALVTLAQAA